MNNLPPRFARQSRGAWLLWVLLLAFLVVSLEGAEISFANFFTGLPHLRSFLGEAFPPDMTRLVPILWSLLRTFEMAFAGMAIGVVLSVPLAILASPSQTPVRAVQGAVRSLIAVFRTVPDLVWALVFVIAVGLGPFAGTLAIVIDTVGFCGRFFSEAMEEVDRRPQEALLAIGASRMSIIACAVLPAAFPSFVNTSLFALEKATRSSVVLGLVGAGGIGLELKVAMDMFRYERAATIIILMFLLVMIVEKISMKIRVKVI